nr:RAD52 motif-containing protein 1 [Vicugna pacos]
MAELVPFVVPTRSNKTLLVWELSSGPGTKALQVHLGTRRKAVQLNALALSSSRCQELANFYFGFNGWSKRIIKVNCRFSLTNQTPFNIEILDFREKIRTGLWGDVKDEFLSIDLPCRINDNLIDLVVVFIIFSSICMVYNKK